MAIKNRMTRRKFARTTAMAAAATAFVPGLITSCSKAPALMKRRFGRIGFEVTTLGLGGQASLQWTPSNADPVKIILKAFDLGINYYDTSNIYGPSPSYYGEAFKIKKLIPGSADYDENLRKSIFIASKTHLRYAKGGEGVQDIPNWTDGQQGSHTIDDLHRSLSLLFGDGKGNYPEGAYLDMMMIHNLNFMNEVDALYEGYENTDPSAERIGALAALRDYRDGTNRTGLNPENKKLIRHVGFSGHHDPSVNMYMIQRDKDNLLDAMLVALNANDKLYFSMQNNVIPLAVEKDMGVIAMKVFADGAMFTKEATWTQTPDMVVQTVGSEMISSDKLVKYTLTTPGVHVAIIGTGHISTEESECQLTNNLTAAQVLPDGLTEAERAEIEELAAKIKGGKTNYFQAENRPLTAPETVTVVQKKEGNKRNVTVSWNTAYAGDSPISSYEVWRDGTRLQQIPFKPQRTVNPFTLLESLDDKDVHTYVLKVVDSKNRIAESLPVILDNLA